MPSQTLPAKRNGLAIDGANGMLQHDYISVANHTLRYS
jgi:hypothetical protein